MIKIENNDYILINTSNFISLQTQNYEFYNH